MVTKAQIPILVSIIIYGIFIYVVAIWTSKNTKDSADYTLAGRKLSGMLTALGAGASDMSSWLLMALPGAVYLSGLSMIWMPVALSIGAYLNWVFVGKRLRIYTEIANDSLTLPAYFENRFQAAGKTLRLVSTAAIIVFFTTYSVAGFVSGAIVTKLMFGISHQMALYISSAIIILYTTVGGFLAVNRIDFFQGCLMFFALLVVPIVTMLNLNGVENTFNLILASDASKLDLLANVKTLGIISLAAWGLGYFGQPHILVRFMAIRSVKEFPLARRVCMSWMIISLIGAVLTGLFGFAYFLQSSPIENHETVFIQLANILFNPWITGILLAALLSAVMSTVSAQILMSGSVIAEDIYHGFIRKHASDKEYLLVNRVAVIVISLIAVWFAADPKLTVLGSVGFAWSGLGASFGPIILFSLYWPRMTQYGAIAGILTGGATVIAWGLLEKYYGGFFANPDILPGFSLLPAYVIASLAIAVISLISKHPNNDVISIFNRTKTLANS